MTRRANWLLSITILALLLSGLGYPPRTLAEGERLVLAFYYPWFDGNAWKSGKFSDLPQTLYNSDDHGAMARQVDQAKGAGIDAFILNWWGKGNRTEKNLKALLDIAAQKGFRVAVDFDINSPVMKGVGSYVDNLKHLHGTHAAHPAYLRHGGRPVVFFYNVSRLSVGAWQNIRNQVDPGRNAIWIAEGTSQRYLSVFDGHHLYSITWPNRVPPSKTLPKWGDRVRAYGRDHGTAKLWVATVMPGYDDRKVRSGNGFVRSRDGGEYYRQTWQAAIASKPHWVVINSFNEWAEGTQIEPSQAYGGLYLDLTRDLSDRFKGSDFAASLVAPVAAPPAPTPTRVPLPTPTPVPADYALAEGWAFSQGASAQGVVFAVTNEKAVPFWDFYRSAGGPLSIGYPTSERYRWQGFVLQDFQSGLLAWHPRLGTVYLLDGFDEAVLAAFLTMRW